MLRKRSSFSITCSVIFALVLREVRGKFAKKRMGAFWFVFEPMAHVLIILAIFSIWRHRTLPGFELPVFLINGIVPFVLFKNIALKGMEAVNSNRGLLSYRQIKPLDMIVARTIVETALMLCVYIFILLGLWWFFGFDVAIHRPIEWLIVIAVGISMALGAALVFCIIIDIMPEAGTVIRIMHMPLYLMSGVVLPLWLMPENLLHILLFNPYVHLIDLLRENSIAHYPQIAGVTILYPLGWAIGSLAVGGFLYRLRRLKLIAI